MQLREKGEDDAGTRNKGTTRVRCSFLISGLIQPRQRRILIGPLELNVIVSIVGSTPCDIPNASLFRSGPTTDRVSRVYTIRSLPLMLSLLAQWPIRGHRGQRPHLSLLWIHNVRGVNVLRRVLHRGRLSFRFGAN